MVLNVLNLVKLYICKDIKKAMSSETWLSFCLTQRSPQLELNLFFVLLLQTFKQ